VSQAAIVSDPRREGLEAAGAGQHGAGTDSTREVSREIADV